ncbi:MAG: DUF6160 family protein [Flavobacteriales bacterium]
MKLFPQLALVSAIAISGNAMAMQALDDESLSAATGQDGITLYIAPPTPTAALIAAGFGTATYSGALTIDNVFIHDKDGVNGLTAGNPATPVVSAGSAAGAIVLGNPNGTNGLVIAGSAGIKVDIDADSNAGDPLLNVKVALPTKLTVRTGDIGVATSKRVAGTSASDFTLRGIDAAKYNKILSSLDLELGGTELNIQLGAEAQGAMIKVAGKITDGLTISGLELFDTKTGTAADLSTGVLGTKGGSIYVGKINVQDSGPGTNLTLAVDIDVSANGLIMTMGGSTKTDILMNDVRLGNAVGVANTNWDTKGSIGDVEIVGLAMAGTKIAVYGH